jgi:hypothetical protein
MRRCRQQERKMEPQNTQNTQIDSEVNRLSGRIIGCALTVQCTLAVALLEKVYVSALAHEPLEAGSPSRNDMECPFGVARRRD